MKRGQLVFLALFALFFSSDCIAQPGLGGAGYRLIRDHGSDETIRQTVNFLGDLVSCADDAVNYETECTVAGTWTGCLAGEYAQSIGATGNLTCDDIDLGEDTVGGYAASATEGGPATTALALNADPTTCTNQFVRDIAASGTLTCATVASADIGDDVVNGVDLTDNIYLDANMKIGDATPTNYVQISTGGSVSFVGAAEFSLPVFDGTPNVSGEVQIDSTFSNMDDGDAIVWYDADSVRMVMDLDSTQFPGTTSFVPYYNATTDLFEQRQLSTGLVVGASTITVDDTIFSPLGPTIGNVAAEFAPTTDFGANTVMLDDAVLYMPDGDSTTLTCTADTPTRFQIMNDGTLQWCDGGGSPTTEYITAAFGTSIDSSEITDGTIVAADIATDAVETTEIKDGTIATIDIADDAVTGDKMPTSVGGRSLTLNTTPSPDQLDADSELYSETNCMIIETPSDSDNFLWFRAERALTVTGIDCLVNASTSTVITVQECGANGTSCGTTEAAMTCTTTNTTESSTIDDSAVDAGDWMRIDVGTVTGTVGHVAVCITFEWND